MKILLVRLRQIGDVVFTTPVVRAIRERFPEAHLAYLVEPTAAPIVDGNGLLNEVIVTPRVRGIGGVAADIALGRRLRRQRFDMAIDFHGGPRASLLTWLSRAPVRIGYAVAGRSWMYTRVVARPRVLRARHSVENQWDLIEGLGVPAPSPSRYPVEMTAGAQADGAVVERLAQAGSRPGDCVIVMHVSAGNPFRRWPILSFAEVAATLAARAPGTRVIVTSGPSDTDAAARVVSEARARLSVGDRDSVIAWRDDLSLAHLRALVDHAALYIGGDSGPMHVAAASHVPIVSLYGPTLPARSRPWRDQRWGATAIEVPGLECRPCDQRVCVPGDFRCLGLIEPAEVVRAAERLLSLVD